MITVKQWLRQQVTKVIGNDLVWTLLYKINSKLRGPNQRYSIGIVTYVARFEPHFKPLIRQLYAQYPDTQIIVAANGYYDVERQEQYLKELAAFLRDYPNVLLLQHVAPQSLSRLWNTIILNATAEKALILNDDLTLLPPFRRELELSGLLSKDLGLINHSWSHFLISRQIVSVVGWFDERFPAVGNEDEDYEARLATCGLAVESVRITSVNNLIFETKDFSYGASVATAKVKYVSANKEFFDKKWSVSAVPSDGFVWVRILDAYARLNNSMETPNFYPDFFEKNQ